MNRAEITKMILVWRAVAAQAKNLADQLREQLATDAQAELDAQGSAPPECDERIGTEVVDIMTALEMALTEPID